MRVRDVRALSQVFRVQQLGGRSEGATMSTCSQHPIGVPSAPGCLLLHVTISLHLHERTLQRDLTSSSGRRNRMNAVAALARHISVVQTSSRAAQPKLRPWPAYGGGTACWKPGSTSVCCAYRRLHDRRAGARHGAGSRTRALEAKALIVVPDPEASPLGCDPQLALHSCLAAADRITLVRTADRFEDAKPKAPLL